MQRIALALWGLCAVWAAALGVVALAGDTGSVKADGPALRDDAAGGPPAPRIRLPDARGGRTDTARFAGRPYAVTFLSTDCTGSCPPSGRALRAALARLGPRARGIRVVTVSVDPLRDTPRAARRWLARLRLPPNFRYLVGSRRELSAVWRAYGVTQHVNHGHGGGVWLVDRRGRQRGRYLAPPALSGENLAHELGSLLDEA
jgi:protein SCO1/2